MKGTKANRVPLVNLFQCWDTALRRKTKKSTITVFGQGPSLSNWNQKLLPGTRSAEKTSKIRFRKARCLVAADTVLSFSQLPATSLFFQRFNRVVLWRFSPLTPQDGLLCDTWVHTLNLEDVLQEKFLQKNGFSSTVSKPQNKTLFVFGGVPKPCKN